MKQKIFFIITFVLVSISTSANTITDRSIFRPIEFIEQGIQFTIFQNGSFDFRFSNNQSINRSSICSKQEIVKDYHGKVRRVGTVLVDYDRYGRLTRIGNIAIRFNNRAISSIGGLNINYNHFGSIYYSGSVSRVRNYQKQYHHKIAPANKKYKKGRSKLKSSRNYKKSRRA
jgi:hypothetical protein